MIFKNDGISGPDRAGPDRTGRAGRDWADRTDGAGREWADRTDWITGDDGADRRGRAHRSDGPRARGDRHLLAADASADAGDYHVYTCRTPSGESAPADGWSGAHTGPETFAEDTCAQPGGALVAALRGGTARTANADSVAVVNNRRGGFAAECPHNN